MSGIVTCDKIVKALAEGLENATELEKEGICESLACCQEEPKTPGEIVCEAFDEIMEVDEAPEGGKVVVRDENGNCFVSPAPKGGGDICESFDTLPDLAGFGTSPRLVISNEEGCGIVSVPAKGIFTDIRAEANVSQGTLLEGGVSTVRFTARNVSQIPAGPIRLIATFPSTDPTDPEFTSDAPTFTNASGAAITQVTPGVFDIDELGAGAVVTVNYLTTFGVQGSYIFSTTVEIQAANAIDFDSADDYATTSVSVRYREEPSPEPEICPLMGVTVTGGGLTDAPVSLRSDTGAIVPSAPTSPSYPENLMLVPLVDGKASMTISTEVPVTLLPYMGPVSSTLTQTTLIAGGKPYIGDYTSNNFFAENPQTIEPSPYVQVSSNLDNTQFTLEADTTFEVNPNRGFIVRVAVRPNEGCIWQQFAIYFGFEVEPSTLSFSGGSPDFLITDAYSPNPNPKPAVLVGGIPALLGGVFTSTGNGPINMVEEAIVRPNSGTAYSFTVTSEGPVNLGTTSVTGNISIDVVSNTEWDITIAPTANSNDNVTIGRLRFEFND